MEEKSSEKKALNNRLQLLVTLVAVLAPLFYLVGIGFYHGHLATFGISSETFDYSTQKVYLGAYVAITNLLFSLSNWILENLINLLTSIQTYIVFTILLLFAYVLSKLPCLKQLINEKLTSSIKSFCSKLHWDNNDATLAFGVTSAFLI
jgi:uncharacterized membrane protein